MDQFRVFDVVIVTGVATTFCIMVTATFLGFICSINSTIDNIRSELDLIAKKKDYDWQINQLHERLNILINQSQH